MTNTEAFGWIGANHRSKCCLTIHNDYYRVTLVDSGGTFAIDCTGVTVIEAVETAKNRLDATLKLANEAVASIGK